MSKLVLANKYFRNEEFRLALELYVEVASSSEMLERVLSGNISACRLKILEASGSDNEFVQSSSLVHFKSDNVLVPGAKVLFISHDASLTGAPAVLISIARWLKSNKAIIPIFVIGGESEDRINEFETIGRCFHVKDISKCTKLELSNFIGCGLNVIYVNTVASGRLLQKVLNSEVDFSALKVTVLHIHEKQGVINHFKAEALYSLEKCEKIISDANGVVPFLSAFSNKRRIEVEVIPPFIDPRSIRAEGLDGTSAVRTIFGCGTIESRKGFDIFCETIYKLKRVTELQFNAVWIGASSNSLEPYETLRRYDVVDVVKCVGKDPDPQQYYKEGDIFFMSSREDPFPLVCLQAADSGMPVVCFDSRAGDISDFVKEGNGGIVCEYLNADDAAKSIAILLENYDLSILMGKNAREHFRSKHTSDSVMPRIVEYIERKNVVVGNQVSVLIISFGPLPIFDIAKVEGGGLRSWGLARGIASLESADVTVTFPEYYCNGHTDFSAFKEFKVNTWSDLGDLLQQVSRCKTVIFSYCYGDYSKALVAACRADQIVVLDCYVPIHVEVCARISENKIDEYISFEHDSRLWLEVFSRGDLILCSNTSQRDYYRGMQFALGLIHPINYDQADNLIVAPFGIDLWESSEYAVRVGAPIVVGSNDAFNLLWFGGVYPWFDVELIIRAIKIVRETVPCTLTIVGAKNPFNNHPDFLRKSESIINLAQSVEYSDFIFVKDWVDYGDREGWYRAADLLVTLNKKGIENGYAWRTRVLDYLSFGVPFATNGGDPLTDFLSDTGFCYHLNDSCLDAMVASLVEAISLRSTSKLSVANDKLHAIRKRLDWRIVGQDVFAGVQRLINN